MDLAVGREVSSSLFFVGQRGLEAADYGTTVLQQGTRSWDVLKADSQVSLVTKRKVSWAPERMSAYAAVQKAADFTETKPWKQGTALHRHSGQGEIGLQCTLISILSDLVSLC